MSLRQKKAIERFEDWMEDVIKGYKIPEGYILMERKILGKDSNTSGCGTQLSNQIYDEFCPLLLNQFKSRDSLYFETFDAAMWHVEMPAIIAKSISILSDAGLGMAMFSLGLRIVILFASEGGEIDCTSDRCWENIEFVKWNKSRLYITYLYITYYCPHMSDKASDRSSPVAAAVENREATKTRTCEGEAS